ncbi:DUF2946 family protein [Pseudomonas sp. 8209]|uniref:DUF2946 family protein n=1 Tax=Pseudomonas sp. 8209 TaxID=2967214 RepID=UPI0030824BF8
MHRSAARRRSLTWLLYASVFFAVLHCGLGQGQAIGLTLNGLGGAFCGHIGAVPRSISFEQWLGDGLAVGATLDCPLCSHTGLAFTSLQFSLPFADPAVQTLLPIAPATWPRRFWPPANPRASPALT